MTGSAVFFTMIVGLSATQVGLGLTVAGVGAFLLSYPLGKTVDRIGAKRAWAISAFVKSALFLLWPTIDGLPQYIAMACAMELAGSLGGAAHGSYVISVLPPEERVTSRAYAYAALNAGFTLGSLAGGLALAFEDLRIIASVPIATGAIFVATSIAIALLPRARHDVDRITDPSQGRTGRGPLRNFGWMSTTFFRGVMWSNQVLLNIVIPLWLVERTDAPWSVLALLFGTNTLMCVFLPMLVARGVSDRRTALRAIRLATTCFVVCCIVALLTDHSDGMATIILFFFGHVALTGGELHLSAASWTLEAELIDPRRRGEYLGAAEISGILGRVWAPATFTFVALNWGALGWLTIAATFVIAGACLHPSSKAGRRWLEQNLPPEALADARSGAE